MNRNEPSVERETKRVIQKVLTCNKMLNEKGEYSAARASLLIVAWGYQSANWDHHTVISFCIACDRKQLGRHAIFTYSSL